MKKFIFIFIVLAAMACTSDEKKKFPENFDFGVTEEGHYKNDYFGMEIFFNPDWVVQDRQQMNDLIDLGTEIASGDDDSFKKIMKASEVNTAYLLSVFKYEIGYPADFNPSIIVVAENLRSYPGVKTGKDYLYHAKKVLEQIQMDYCFEKEVTESKLDNIPFYILETKIDQGDIPVTQEFYATVMNEFCLSFILSYTSMEEKEELYEIIDKIKFSQKK